MVPLPSATALFRRQEPALRGLILSTSARGAAHQAPPPPATRRALVRLPRLYVAPFREGVLLFHLPLMQWRSVCGAGNRHLCPEI